MRTARILVVVVIALTLGWGAGTASAANSYFLQPLGTASAAGSYFLQIEGVEGEATDAEHGSWIDVLSFSQDISTSPSVTGELRSSTRGEVGPLVIVKKIDKATPKLNEFCCSGRILGQVVFEATKPTGDKPVFLRYTLADATIVGTRTFTDPQGNLRQEVQFTFGSIEWRYTEFDDRGRKKGEVTSNWNLFR